MQFACPSVKMACLCGAGSELQKPAIIKLVVGFLLRVEFLTEFFRRLILNVHAVIPLLRVVKPPNNVAKHWAAVLNEFAISRNGATSHKDCSNNTTIMNITCSKMNGLQNDRRKKTAKLGGVLSPLLRGLQIPTPLLQCMDRLAGML